MNALLFKPLPYADPDRLAIVWEHNVARQKRDNVVSPGNYIHWREQARSFEQLAGASPNFRGTLSGGGREPEELPLQLVSANLFPMLGVRPALGRWFRPEEDRAPRSVVIVSHRLWQRRFNSDPGIIDRSITLNGESVAAAGVMPEGWSGAKRRRWARARRGRSRDLGQLLRRNGRSGARGSHLRAARAA